MDQKKTFEIESGSGSRSSSSENHEVSPLNELDKTQEKFPFCLVWTPLPIVSWLAPFIGHVGIGRKDGSVVDFSGCNFVKVDEFTFGRVAMYLQLDPEQCCFAQNISEHTCKDKYKHAELGRAISWDDAIETSTRHYESLSYNQFTCNSHSFVADCLNELCYGGSMEWNMVNVAVLILSKGRWVDYISVVKSFFPFVLVWCLGILVGGWLPIIGLFLFSLMLIVWYICVTYCCKCLY